MDYTMQSDALVITDAAEVINNKEVYVRRFLFGK